MFIYCTDLKRIEKEHSGDKIICVDSGIKDYSSILTQIEKALDIPSKSTLWDYCHGYIDNIGGENKTIRLLHFEFPDLPESELEYYIAILNELDDNLMNLPDGIGQNRLFIYFPDSLWLEVENMRQYFAYHDDID